MTNKDGDQYFQLSEVKKMIEQSLMESRKEREFQVAEMTEKTDLECKEMCAVERQHGSVRSTVSLALRSVVGNGLDDGVVAGHIQKDVIRAVVYLAMKIDVADALVKNDDLMTPITTFVLK